MRRRRGRALFFTSGRAALLAGLTALGIGPGDEVLLPAYLCESVVTPVETVGAAAGLLPGRSSFEVDLAALEAAITPKTRAVVLIHYLGFPGPVQEVRALCQQRGLVLIEDCAHALFSRLGDRPLGTFGDLAIFSPWKSLPLPDGGLLRVNDVRLRPQVPKQRLPARRTLTRLAYRALGTLEQTIGWSPRLALLQRPGLRKSMHEQVSAGPVECWPARRWRGGCCVARPGLHVVGRRRRNFARLLDACRDLHLGTARLRYTPRRRLPPRAAAGGRGPGPLARRSLRRGVNVRTYWEQLPPAVDSDRFPDAAWFGTGYWCSRPSGFTLRWRRVACSTAPIAI